MPPIDVIIPVYRGLAETRACLESVLAARNQSEREIIVIDDASPEPALADWLDTLAGRENVTLLRNPTNCGFVGTVNRGMALHADRDVVLLNSDTRVPDGWLDKLANGAARLPDAASLCPFSNNATLASYPRPGVENEIPDGESLESLAAMFAECNAGVAVEVPTTVGFCMFLRRRVLNDVGLFDEATFGTGYGEENDWCLRASAAGYRHFLIADGFVFHKGEVSFAQAGAARRQHAQAVLDQRYPHFQASVQRHFKDDPARGCRRAVDLARLAASRLPKLLFITHHWGGGTEQHVLDLCDMLTGKAEILVMRPHSPHSVRIEWRRGAKGTEDFDVFFDSPDDLGKLAEFLHQVGVNRVHLHHIHGHAPEVLEMVGMLHVPIDVTLHDYFPLTAQYHLDQGGALPANEPNHAWGLSREAWQARMGQFLKTATRVISPSRDLADRIRAVWPQLAIQVWPHPEPVPFDNHPAKVLLLGGLTRDKGQDVVLACAKDAKSRDLPLFFRLIGHTQDALPVHPDLPLSVAGSYRSEDIDLLIGLERADVVMLPAQIPESFSYTLSASMRSGLPIVASRLGAFPERLAGYPNVELIDWNAPAENWNAALLRLARKRSVGADTAKAEWAAYRDRYLDGVAPADKVKQAPKLAMHHFYAERALPREAERTLEALFVGAVECGHAPSRHQLKRRIAETSRALDTARDEVERAHEAAREAGRHFDDSMARFKEAYDAQVESAKAAHAAYQGILNSTTWRRTQPLRDAVVRARRQRARVEHLIHQVRHLPNQGATALQIARTHGAGELLRRVRARLARPTIPVDLPATQYVVEQATQPLIVPFSDQPRWSVVIPVYGQHAHTFTCLKSLSETCTGLPIEVLVVDDCSPEPAAEALAQVNGVRFLRNAENLGFLQTCNKAVAETRGEFVVLLNNDTLALPGWLPALMAVFESDAKAGLAGAKLLFADGRLQEAGGIVWRDGSASNYGRGDDPRRPEFNYRRDVDYCSGACLMIRRALWDELGGFDVRYAPAYYEDTDLAFRVREAGYRVVYQPHAEVVHFEGQTSGTDLSSGAKRYQVINQGKFEERWRKTLSRHRNRGLAPHLERERSATRRVLVIDVCVPMPDRDSGSMRMFEMLGLLRSLGCAVTFVGHNGLHLQTYVRALQSLGVEVLHAPFVQPLTEAVTRLGGDFDVVILSRAMVAVEYADLVKRHMARAKFIYDTVDLHFLRQDREANLAASDTAKEAAAAMKRRELDLISKADVTLVVSEFERELLEREAPRAQVQVVSNIHEPEPGAQSFSEREGLLFIGGFRHAPNVDAMSWYATEILPRLREKRPGLRTTVIGADVPERLLALGAEDFVFAGHVAEVRPLFDGARLSISPLRYGAGVKGKVNLSMQLGVPVVATSCSIEGMNLRDGRDVLVADFPDAFVDAILRVHDDESAWTALREGGLENLRKWFSRDRARRVLKNLLDL